jgi:hypothetical protein
MWYPTIEEATKAAEQKTKYFGYEFIVLKDKEQPDCYWAQRKSALNDR